MQCTGTPRWDQSTIEYSACGLKYRTKKNSKHPLYGQMDKQDWKYLWNWAECCLQIPVIAMVSINVRWVFCGNLSIPTLSEILIMKQKVENVTPTPYEEVSPPQ